MTDSAGNNNWPDFSPDGRQIVFASSRTGNYEICVMNADGANVRQLTDSPLQDIRPRFSPDGQRIAFTSHRDGNAELYVINPDGTGERRITAHDERDDYPAWHPNGKQIVAVCERDGEFDLYLIEVQNREGEAPAEPEPGKPCATNDQRFVFLRKIFPATNQNHERFWATEITEDTETKNPLLNTR
ncbi:MAG: hypothetical protein U0992_06355 [Planctomycetaceae bacterium]